MTSLGKCIFVDIHSRQSRHLLSNTSLENYTETLSLAFENLFYMPFNIIENYGSRIHTLDISYNQFGRNVHCLAEFDNLTSLNLDHNNIDHFTVFPYMPQLRLLWLNYNKIEYLFPFLKNLNTSFPNLQYLSLMGNKAAPSYFNGGSFYDYLQYRLLVISWFPQLSHLDDRAVTDEQRMEAKRLFKRPIFEELIKRAPLPDCIKLLQTKLSTMFTKPVVLPQKFRFIKGTNLIV